MLRRTMLRRLRFTMALALAAGLMAAPLRTQQAAPPLSFDTVSIKPSPPEHHGSMSWGFAPNGYKVNGQSLWATVAIAYGWHLGDGAGRFVAPDWTKHEFFDIEAHIAAKDADAWSKQTPEQAPLLDAMLRQMLRERCHLVIHTVAVDAPVYRLVLAGESRLESADPSKPLPQGAFPVSNGASLVQVANGPTSFYNITIRDLARQLTLSAGRRVIDATGLEGRYNLTLHHWSEGMSVAERSGSLAPDGAHQWKLTEVGLELRPGAEKVEQIVVDRIERPSPN